LQLAAIPFFCVLFVGASIAATAGQPAPAKLERTQSATANAPNSRAFNAGRDIIFRLEDREPIKPNVVGSKVAITNAYLLPSYNFFETTFGRPENHIPNQTRDAAFLCVEVVNISSQPLLVTAMKLDVINPQKLSSGPGIILGSCPVEKVSGVSPECLLQPGQHKRWLLQKGIVMRGAGDFIKQQSDEYIMDVERPRRTNNDDVIRRFNEFLRASGVAKTTLKVSIFELNYKPVLIGHFQLAEGETLFSTEPSVRWLGGKKTWVFPLQHDSFLGEALSQLKDNGDLRERALSLSCGNKPARQVRDIPPHDHEDAPLKAVD
jgi:hypothetical protein